jgi:hypothetical protein
MHPLLTFQNGTNYHVEPGRAQQPRFVADKLCLRLILHNTNNQSCKVEARIAILGPCDISLKAVIKLTTASISVETG